MKQAPIPRDESQRFAGYAIAATFEPFVKYLRWALPKGRSLPDDVWQSRHRGICTLLWLHVIGVVCFGLIVGARLEHSLAEGAVLAVMAVTASWPNTPRRFRSSMASLGLITASAVLVHLSGGYIEMHFHFFVMLAVIVLYQDWIPFLLALGYVVIHHGAVGVFDPSSVYNHPDAFIHPWKWAAIHGGFVLAASIAGIVSWRLSEALRTHNELILNSTSDGIIGLDLQGNITFANPAAARMIGYKVEELKNHPLHYILYSAKVDGVPAPENEYQIQALLQEGGVQPVIEGLFWRKGGVSFLAEYVGTPIREGGAIVGAVVTFKDITERKQAQVALQKAKDELEIRVAERTAELNEINERLRFELAERQRAEEALAKRAAELEESRNFLDSIIENIPNILFIKDAKDLSFVRVNRAGEELNGLDREEMIGKNDYDFVPKEEADFFTAKDRMVLAGGKLMDIPEESMHTTHKGIRLLHTRKAPILGADGKPKYLLGISEDITERKQIEVALKENEERTRLIIDTALDAVITMDAEGLITDWNVQAENMFGWSHQEVIGQLLSTIIIPIQYREAHQRGLQHFLATGEGPVLNKRIEITALHRDEHEFPIELSISPLRLGEKVIFSAFVSDITQRKQAEAALAQARDQALEASRLKTELLAKISHELRTPLGAILGFAEMVEMDVYGPLSDKKRQMITKIIDSTQYLTTLVNELLDQAQLEAGRLRLNVQPFVPANLVDNTLAKLSVLARAKGLSLTNDIAADVPTTLSGDADRLQQILVNLVSNAIKFTAEGQVRVWLYCPDAGHWALQVSDTGSGIPAEAQTYIFEPFRQVDGSMTRARAGTGLGLSIVKQLTTLMGGQITLESEVGRGSTFTVSLPLQPIQEKIV